MININQYRYSENEDEKLLLEEADLCYHRMIDAITSNCINEMPNETEPPSQILQVPNIQNDQRNIFDTRNLSEINLVYNNVTFQVSPKSDFINE